MCGHPQPAKFLSVVKERDLPDSPGPVRSALQPGCASGSRQSRRRAFRTAKQKGAGKKLRLAFSNARIMVTIPDYYVDTTLGVDGRVAADAAQSVRSSAPGVTPGLTSSRPLRGWLASRSLYTPRGKLVLECIPLGNSMLAYGTGFLAIAEPLSNPPSRTTAAGAVAAGPVLNLNQRPCPRRGPNAPCDAPASATTSAAGRASGGR